MKQKYLIARDEETNSLTIRESAELEPGKFSLLCAESFDFEKIQAAMALGKEALIIALRTHNMYPPADFAGPIADAVAELFTENGSSRELFFDDMDFISRADEMAPSFEGEEEAADIEDLLEEDLEEDTYNEDDFDDLDDQSKTNIQLAEDEGGVDDI